jgi:hypothetical protein
VNLRIKLVAALAAATVLAGGLIAADISAVNARTVAYDCPPDAYGQPGYNDNGSGCLDPLWGTRAHGQYGTLVGADVILVGDSITTLCKSYFTSRVQAQGLTWGVSYWSGRPTKPAVDWALSLSVKPRVLVMAIGTNDIYNPGVMAAQIARLKAGMPNTDVRWVDVRAKRPAFATADMRNSRNVNAQIWDAAGITPIKWMGWFDEMPSREAMYIQPQNGVHPTPDTEQTGYNGCNFWGGAVAPAAIGAAKAAKLKASTPR